MRRLLVIAICIVGVAACGAQQAAEIVSAPATPRDASSASATAGTAVSERATTPDVDPGAPPEDGAATSPASTATVSSPDFPTGGEDIAYLTEVRVGRHEGFDRVVWNFDGPAPSYRIGYVDLPVTEDGSGNVVQLEGEAALQAIFSPASGVDMSGPELETVYTGPDRIDGDSAGTTAVRAIVETGDFEATLSWAVGLDAQVPFTVSELSDPTRVVVDVATD
jgi:hypothetical protein